jgi:hypothetical protein
MEDLASLVLEKMSDDDGESAMSVLISHPHRSRNMLVVPFKSKGEVTFNVFFSDSVTGFQIGFRKEGINFVNSEVTAMFMVEHAKTVFSGGQIGLRFVQTSDIKDGHKHICIDLDKDKNEALRNVLMTVPYMTPLKSS